MMRAWHRPACAIAAALLAMLCPGALAHPLGNNTVSRQAVLDPGERQVTLTYRMDLAEIPSLAAADAADRDGDGATSRGEWQAHATRWSREVERAVSLSADGRRIALTAERARFRLRPGEAGLDVLFLEAELRGTWDAAAHRDVAYRDAFRPADTGWKEVMVRAHAGQRIDGAVARTDRSRGLTDYPRDGALPQEVSAAFRVAWAPAVAAAPASAVMPVDVPVPPAGTAREESDAVAPPAAPVAAGESVTVPEAGGGDRPGRSSLAGFFMLGMHHIAVGVVHLAFLLGLLLLSRRLPDLIKLVSAFTVAHSVTLILAAGHVVTPPGEWVEPAIAFTIAYVGFIAWRGRARAHGAALAFLFGLVHGFGFAGALAESLGETAGGSGWLLDLLAFNLGIEAVQIALVAAAVGLAARLRTVRWRAAAHAAASLAVLGAGLAWLVVRLVVPGQA